MLLKLTPGGHDAKKPGSLDRRWPHNFECESERNSKQLFANSLSKESIEHLSFELTFKMLRNISRLL